MLTTNIAKFCEWLWKFFKEVQEQSTAETKRQKWYYDRKANAVLLEPGDLVLAKANTYKWKRKVKDQWEEELYEVECQVVAGIPFLLVKNQQTGWSQVLHQNRLFLITPWKGTPHCMVMWAEQARCATTTLGE